MVNLNSFPDSIENFDPTIERNVISCIAKSGEAWLTATFHLTTDDFAIDLNKALWITIDSLRTREAQVDPVVLYDALPEQYKKELDEVGGWAYIQVLQDLPLNPDNVQYEIDKLLELSFRRRVGQAGLELKDLSTARGTQEEIKEHIEESINRIDKEADEEVVNIASNGLEFLEKRLANVKEVPGLPTGFSNFDIVIQGLQPGRLYVIGAAQKIGKSITLLNWARNLVSKGIPILWISTEHSLDDEFSRMLSLESNVPEAMINNGTYSTIDTYQERVSNALDYLKGSPFHFVSMPFFTLEKIRRVTRYMTRVHGIKALFFDFIKTNEAGSEKEWMHLGVLSYGLKSLAMKEEIPVVTACQVNRDGKQEFKMTGELDSTHFAGSDRISHAMSVGMILRPPTKKEVENIDIFRVLQITDNRHGVSNGKWLLNFEPEVLRITENKKL